MPLPTAITKAIPAITSQVGFLFFVFSNATVSGEGEVVAAAPVTAGGSADDSAIGVGDMLGLGEGEGGGGNVLGGLGEGLGEDDAAVGLGDGVDAVGEGDAVDAFTGKGTLHCARMKVASIGVGTRLREGYEVTFAL